VTPSACEAVRLLRPAPGEIVHIDIKKLDKFNRIGHRRPHRSE
jgi:hypothetical protein